jgi:heptosyltransferase-1
MKILIVKISALGDVAHALPAALYLRNRLPEARIDWLVEETFAPLLEPLPYLDHILPINIRAVRRRHSFRELKRLWKGLRQIRAIGYDYVFDLQGNIKSAFYTLASGAPQRFGFDRTSVREWPNLLATNRRVPLEGSTCHVSDRSLAVVMAAFPGGEIPSFGQCLRADPAATADVHEWLQENGAGPGAKVVVCHPGTTWKTKMWSCQRWSELLGCFHDREDIHFVLTWGSSEEKELVEQIRRESGGHPLLWRGGTIPELVALLELADLTVGGDTGPVHMAAALNRPTVSLFRATDARRNAPRGDNHLSFQAPLDCSPCLLKRCDRDGMCSASISVAEVAGAVERLLSSGRQPDLREESQDGSRL